MNYLSTSYKIIRAWIKNEKRPLNVSLVVTNACNLRCSYCDIPQTRTKDNLTKEEIFKMQKEFSQQGMVKFSCTGGEPLLRKDIGDIISNAHDLGAITSMTTNGTLIPQRAKSLKKLNTILISVDGDQEQQNITKQSTVDKLIRNIELIKENGTNVWLSTVLLQGTYDRLDYLFHLCQTLDIRILLQPYHNTFFDQKDYDLEIKQDELAKIYRTARDKFPQFIANTPDYIDMILENRELSPPSCLAGLRTCFINSNGNIYPCAPIMLREGKTPNGLKEGWVDGFYNMPEAKCNNCRFPAQAELTNTFSLKPKTWFHLRTALKKSSSKTHNNRLLKSHFGSNYTKL